MNILALADIDDFRWKGGTGAADVVLSCGDVPDQVILEAADAFGCRRIFAVKGNHDPSVPFPKPIVDVHLLPHELDDVSVGGFNGSWRYKPRGYFLYDDIEVDAFLADMPAVDVFIAHNSPRGVHDADDDVHLGFTAFNKYIETHKPSLFIHGHQHKSAESTIGITSIVGVHGHRLLKWEAG